MAAGALHLLGIVSEQGCKARTTHLEGRCSYTARDAVWLQVMADGLRWWAAELGFEDVEIFAHNWIRVGPAETPETTTTVFVQICHVLSPS